MSELEEICRELAERTVNTTVRVEHYESTDTHIAGPVPDPCFEAFRGEHMTHREYHYCLVCGAEREYSSSICLRTDLSAIVHASAACGWDIIPKVTDAIDTWASWYEDPERRGGDTPELAAARALKEAVS